ncbi:MAG: hypothetical protein ACIAQZ_14770 [Sedimentisphaeraceae bacterium JB056]
MKPEKTNELRRIAEENGGLLLPEVVVEKAKEKSNPLHDEFDWNDTTAAHKWRIEQCRALIRRITVILPQTKPKEVRMYVSLDRDRDTGGYRLIEDVISDPERLKELLRTAKNELRAFERKYSELTELSEVFSAAKKITNP